MKQRKDAIMDDKWVTKIMGKATEQEACAVNGDIHFWVPGTNLALCKSKTGRVTSTRRVNCDDCKNRMANLMGP